MSYCCVVGCKSKYKDKVPGVSFHEFPVNRNVREKWIKAVSRKEWLPNDTSSVCSVHFEQSDFKAGGKRRKLKSDAVPTFFPTYPSYMNHPKKALRSSKHISVREALLNAAELTQQSTSEPLYNKEQGTKEIFPGNQEVEVEVIIPDYLVETGNQVNNAAVQVDSQKTKENAEIKQWKRKCYYLQKKLEELQRKNENNLQELLDLKENKYFRSLNKVIDKAEANNNRTHLLLDQLQNFDIRRPVWSEATIRSCIILRSVAPKAYSYMHKTGMFKLPARSTLQMYMGPTDTSTGITPLVKERTITEFW